MKASEMVIYLEMLYSVTRGTTIISVVYFFLFTQEVRSQSVSLSFESTYGTYDMEDFKTAQNNIPFIFLGYGRINLPYKIYSNFEPYYGYNGMLTLHLEKLEVSIENGANSTGSRLSYKDYSGTFESDQLVSNKYWGAGISPFKMSLTDAFFIRPRLVSGVSLSSYSMENFAELTNTNSYINQLIVVKSKQLFFEPQASIGFTKYRFIVSASVGYHLQVVSLKEKVIEGSEAEWQAYFPSGEPKPQWNGVRLKAGLGFILLKKKSKAIITKA
ncbi:MULTISPECIES: hypothetical protein [unclassified Imperialibacter]|uniref:hypothetical protein n=1 Tax=unclassified Imperialibacter TaxID=2629706 RepID=UPI00125EF5B7|nr:MULTISPECIES: hypothetical protein [unclassified Imperialibacter]CAD5298729.1 hypothetical protein IMPERIA75_700517 [Imperialibacter sp. 75]